MNASTNALRSDSASIPRENPAAPARILVVDDNPLQLKSQRLQLEKAGYVVTTAAGAVEAFAAVEAELPDLVISDVMMPLIDGFQLCRALRRDPLSQAVPIILISGCYGEALDVRHAANCGANMFISRSDGTAALVRGIRKAMEEPAARLELADDSTLDAEHAGRVIKQLDRLSQANVAAARRIDVQKRLLSQIGATAEKMAGLTSPDQLAQYLVAAGLPHVLVYRLNADGKLELADQAGCDKVAQQAAALFGEGPFFEQLVARNRQMVLPDAAAPAGLIEIFVQNGFRSAALLPLACEAERFGLLIVPSSRYDRRNSDGAVFAKAMAAQLGAILSLGRSRQAMQDSHEQLRAILNGIADGVFVTDGDFVIRDANPALSRIAGYTQQEARGKPVFVFVPPQARARLRTELRRYAETGQYEGDFPFVHKDGSTRQAHVTGRRVRPDLYVNVLRDVTEAQRNEELMQRLGQTDALTGLPNRAAFQQRLERAAADAIGGSYAAGVLLLSLGNFREVNDTLGPDGGDRVLCETAARIEASAGATGIVSARLGAAQFGVLLPRLDGAEHLVRAAHALMNVLATPILVDGIPVEVAPCIGAAQCPDDALLGTELLRRASVAMHQARTQHMPFLHYSAEQDPFSLRQLTLVSELRQAIAHNHLELWYQPKLDLKTGRVDAVEALVRWRHPERGLIPPDGFIPAAERTGLISLITSWVLQTALKQSRQWHDRGLCLNVAINISQNDLREASFPAKVLQAIQRHGLPPSSLTLEITESSAMHDPRRVVETLGALRKQGVRISLDDFGTGQASLAHLHRLPVDEIKLDKSFVLNLPDEHSRSIAGVTTMLARAFGLNSVAEGMESADSQAMLRDLGFGIVQGYHLCKPLPAAELEAWIRQRDVAQAA